jgi:ribose 5-phosphate isomerase A
MSTTATNTTSNSFENMTRPLSTVESAKRLAAQRAVDEHFPHNARYVGIGSGSTVVYVVEAISQLGRERVEHVKFVPTGYQSKELILQYGLKLSSVEMAGTSGDTMIDVVFDGADEVDPFLNCIKGGGACLFQEKLVAISARKFVVVAGGPPVFPSPYILLKETL